MSPISDPLPSVTLRIPVVRPDDLQLLLLVHELTSLAGIRRATVNRLENDRVKVVALDVLEKLARVFEVDAGYLLEKKEK